MTETQLDDGSCDVTGVVIHVDVEKDGRKASQEMTVAAALNELAAMAPDLATARATLEREAALTAALVLAMPVGVPQEMGPGRSATLVQMEGSRFVSETVFCNHAAELVKLGLATERVRPAEKFYEHGGVSVLTKPGALAILAAAGIEGLVARRPGRKELVLTTIPMEEAA